jgi:AraC-like DNA-binding protein
VFRNVLILEGVVAQTLGLLLVAALVSARPRSNANRLLALALFCVVSRQFLLMLEISRALWASPWLFRLSFPFQLLAIPAFYLYVQVLTRSDSKLQRRDAVHLLPLVFGMTWYFATLVWGNSSFSPGSISYNREVYARAIAKIVVMIPYFIAGRRCVVAFAREEENHISDLSHLRLKWLRTLLGVAYASVLVNFLDVLAGPESKIWLLVPGVWLFSLLSLAFISLRVSTIFAMEAQRTKVESFPDMTEIEQVHDGEAAKRRMSYDELAKQKDRLTQVVEKQALYLNPELRLSDLGAALGLRPYRVSEVLSRGLQTSFYDLINKYRIAKAQELMVSRDSAHLNLLGIAMESGFRSKSVFNEVFKKMTGTTPSEYRMREMTESPDSDSRITRFRR